MNLERMRVFFFDLDGVLTVGKENPRYIGGREVVAKIKHEGKKAMVLTNDSTHTCEEIHENLTRLGFQFNLDDILTSSSLTAMYLTEQFGHASFFLIGEEGLRRELLAAGHEPSQGNPTVIVVGFDRQLTYSKLDDALRVLKKGAKLIGSYGGAVYMSDHGPALSAGPIIKALEYASGQKAIMVGKPSPRMFKLALMRASGKAANAVMIGDQLETDILGAERAGVHTILVLTGVESRESVRRSRIRPELIVDSADDLIKLL